MPKPIIIFKPDDPFARVDASGAGPGDGITAGSPVEILSAWSHASTAYIGLYGATYDLSAVAVDQSHSIQLNNTAAGTAGNLAISAKKTTVETGTCTVDSDGVTCTITSGSFTGVSGLPIEIGGNKTYVVSGSPPNFTVAIAVTPGTDLAFTVPQHLVTTATNLPTGTYLAVIGGVKVDLTDALSTKLHDNGATALGDAKAGWELRYYAPASGGMTMGMKTFRPTGDGTNGRIVCRAVANANGNRGTIATTAAWQASGIGFRDWVFDGWDFVAGHAGRWLTSGVPFACIASDCRWLSGAHTYSALGASGSGSFYNCFIKVVSNVDTGMLADVIGCFIHITNVSGSPFGINDGRLLNSIIYSPGSTYGTISLGDTGGTIDNLTILGNINLGITHAGYSTVRGATNVLMVANTPQANPAIVSTVTPESLGLYSTHPRRTRLRGVTYYNWNAAMTNEAEFIRYGFLADVLNADPQFADPANYDFRPTNPAVIGKGWPLNIPGTTISRNRTAGAVEPASGGGSSIIRGGLTYGGIMRKGEAFEIFYTARDADGAVVETVANHTLRLIIDGVLQSTAPTNTPAHKANGVYCLVVSAAESASADSTIAITGASSTSGVIIDGMMVGIEDPKVGAYGVAEDSEIETLIENAAAIKIKTDELPAAPASTGDVTSGATTVINALALGVKTTDFTSGALTAINAINAKTINIPSEPATAAQVTSGTATVVAAIADIEVSATVDPAPIAAATKTALLNTSTTEVTASPEGGWMKRIMHALRGKP